jgi:Domain of unknown function (DUF4440)
MTHFKCIFFTLLVSLLYCCASGQVNQKTITGVYKPVSQQLYDEIYEQDSLLFAAFNEHNTEKLMAYFSEDLEFYHDKGGVSDYAGTANGFKNLFKNNKETGLRRDIIPGSMEVYPINNFGAVATSLHRFCHKENGKDDCGTFKNIMLYKKTTAGWKITRVISYDH